MNRNNHFHIVGRQLVPGIPFCPSTLLASHHEWLVGFFTIELDFGGEYVPGLRLFPGGEWHQKEPIWWLTNWDERPRRLQPAKREVWELANGKTLAVADRRSGLIFVEAAPTGLSLRKPRYFEVASYLHGRARAMTRNGNDRGLNWVRASLRALAGVSRSHEVERIHREVSSLRPRV